MHKSNTSNIFHEENDDLIFSIVHKERPYQPFYLDYRNGLKNYSRRWLLLLRLCTEFEATRSPALLTFQGYLDNFNALIQIHFEDGIKDRLSSFDIAYINARLPARLKQRGIKSIFERAFDRKDLGRELFDDTVNKRVIGILKLKQDSTKTMVTSIVSKAMSPATYASTWAQLETALADGKISNQHFIYFATQATTNARDANLWPCKVSDLIQLNIKNSSGNDEKEWYLRTYLAKARLDKARDKGSLQPLPREVGDRLDLHRKEVISKLGRFFPNHLDEIALFPSFLWQEIIDGTNTRRTRSHGHATEAHKLEWIALLGRFATPGQMRNSYLYPISKLLGYGVIGTGVVRHTIGTYLARLGYESRTIARILQHTDEGSAQYYVDLCFAGILDEFGQKFEEQTAPILRQLLKRVEAFVDVNDGRYDQKQLIQTKVGVEIITTGACKTKRCEGVPFQCYLCPSRSFIPFADADHQSVLSDLIKYRDEELPHKSSSFQLEINNINVIALRIEAVIQACQSYKSKLGKSNE
jgi:hypothetical protein